MKVPMAILLAGMGVSLLGIAPAAAQDAAEGEKLFKTRCMTCHTVEPGKHRVGPSLHAVVGRQAGSTDFKRYVGLKDVDFVWDEEALMAYLEDPTAYIKENTDNSRSGMAFKLPKEEERAAVIAYLKTLE
jgi:cytochrome c